MSGLYSLKNRRSELRVLEQEVGEGMAMDNFLFGSSVDYVISFSGRAPYFRHSRLFYSFYIQSKNYLS